jgi:hypothetical protein
MKRGMQMELTRITQEMYETKQRLNIASKEIFTLAKDRAETEKAYKIALRQEILRLKDLNYPATLILELAKGCEKVADLRFKRDVAKTMYDSGRDSMKVTSIEASLLQSILKVQSEV